MLRQISKNVDPYFFEQLIGDLTENIPVDTMPASNGRQTGRIYPTPNSRKIEVSFMKDKHGVWRTWSTFQPKTKYHVQFPVKYSYLQIKFHEKNYLDDE